MTKKARNLLILFGILILSFCLNMVRIGQDGLGNHYYAAAAKSMVSSPSNFFFGSFDSCGFVTVDKPPVGLWIQALVILAFGLSTFSVMLPSVIAGICSVFLMYFIVRKSFGEIAGLSAALILTVTPVFVAISRNNTMDAILITDLLCATWLFQKGLQSGKLRFLLLSAAFIGIGFNIKMMQAFVIIPALFAVYLIYYRPITTKKFLHTILVSVVLVAVSLSWTFAVEMTPEEKRPYIGGSNTNSAAELAIHYNGLDRTRENVDPFSLNRQSFRFETGDPGFFRLFNPLIGGQIGWFIPFVVFGSLLYLGISVKEKSLSLNNKQDLLFWSIWFVVLYTYLSFNSGFFHTHYIAMLSPAVAAMGGVAVVGFFKAVRSRTFLRWLPPGIIILSMLSQWLLGRSYSDWNRPMTIVMAGLSTVSSVVILLILFRKKGLRVIRQVLTGGLLAGMILPVSWSFTPILYGGDPVIPYARPDLKEFKIGEEYFQTHIHALSEYETLIAFLKENREDEKYLLGVESAQTNGSDLMLLTDGDVMTLGGFSGTDPILSSGEIAALVDKGVIRFFLVTSNGPRLNEATAWISSYGEIVVNHEWKQEGELIGSLLFDCQPKSVF